MILFQCWIEVSPARLNEEKEQKILPNIVYKGILAIPEKGQLDLYNPTKFNNNITQKKAKSHSLTFFQPDFLERLTL